MALLLATIVLVYESALAVGLLLNDDLFSRAYGLTKAGYDCLVVAALAAGPFLYFHSQLRRGGDQ